MRRRAFLGLPLAWSWARLAAAQSRLPRVAVVTLGSLEQHPIVMVIGADPVELGIVSNLARPEGNVTGIGTSTQVLIQKRVELLKQLLPDMRRLAALWNSSSAGQTAPCRYCSRRRSGSGSPCIPST